MELKNSIGRIITILSRNIQQELKEVVEPFGITVGEEPYFMELAYEDGLTQDELSSRVNVDKSATARVVKALEKKGFLKREIDNGDRRNKRLYLTEEAREKYELLVDELQQYNLKLTDGWTEEEYDMVYHCLQILQSNYEKRKVNSHTNSNLPISD